MVEWSGKEVECSYEDEALKFVDEISPVILDATTVSINACKPTQFER